MNSSSSHPVLAYLRSVVTRQGAAAEDDCELLRRLVERRDEEAFTVLLQRHGPMVLSLARRVAGDEQTAEDVFQAACLWLFRKGHTIRRPHAMSCWLHGVAHRLALQARRAHGRRRNQEARVRPSSPPNPLDELTAQEFLSVLDEELSKLPEKYREPLILCCLEGLSQEEAARRLGCSAGAVKGRLERGWQRLRLRLEKRGLTLPAVLGGTLLFAGATSPIPAALAQATLQIATRKIVARLKTPSWVAQTAFLPNNRFLALNDLDGIQVRDVRSGAVVARFQMPEAIRAGRTPGSYAGCLAFTRDRRRMATGHPDSTILVWDVPLPSSPTVSVSAKQLESLWAELADTDADKAWRAVWHLADTPQDALPFLRQRVRPCPVVSEDVTRRLLADLDNDSFPRREAAMKRLQELGPQVEAELRAALKAKPSPEQRRRIEELLAALPAALPPPSPEELRQLRALIVLKRIGTPEARRLLEEAAKGPPSARLTRQALSSLACIR